MGGKYRQSPAPATEWSDLRAALVRARKTISDRRAKEILDLEGIDLEKRIRSPEDQAKFALRIQRASAVIGMLGDEFWELCSKYEAERDEAWKKQDQEFEQKQLARDEAWKKQDADAARRDRRLTIALAVFTAVAAASAGGQAYFAYQSLHKSAPPECGPHK